MPVDPSLRFEMHQAGAKPLRPLGAGARRPQLLARLVAPTVRLIYLVPLDCRRQPRYSHAIARAALHLQRWFHRDLGGFTFRLPLKVVAHFKTPHPSAWYAANPPGFWVNTLQDGFRLTGGDFNDPHARWIFYIDAPWNPGAGGIGGTQGVAVLPRHDLEGLAGVDRVCRWVGGLGHELGHALLLDHPPGCGTPGYAHPDCDSLMFTGYDRYPDTFFTAGDRQKLLASAFIRKRKPRARAFDCTRLVP